MPFGTASRWPTPRLSPLVAALLGVFAMYGGLSAAFSRSHLAAMDPAQLRAEVDDDAAVVAGRLMQLRSFGAPARVFIGGSAMREAAPDSIGPEPTLNLASSSQTLGESLSILETLPVPRGSTIFLHLTPHRIAELESDAVDAVEHPRMPFVRTDALARTLHDAGVDVSIFPAFLTQRTWMARFIRRRLDLRHAACGLAPGCGDTGGIWRPLPPYQLHQYADSTLPPLTKDSLARLYELQLALVRTEEVQLGRRLLVAMAHLGTSRDMQLVLVLLPADPRARATERAFYLRPDVQEALGAAVSAGARILDLRAVEEVFPSTDFYDLHHMRASGRVRLESAFARIGTTNGS